MRALARLLIRDLIPALLLGGLAACAASGPIASPGDGGPGHPESAGRLAQVEGDLLGTARERYGEAALARALNSSTYLIAKRYVGFPPPPPPGAGADWKPPSPSALMLKEGGAWLVATTEGWRQARPEVATELNGILAARSFWDEPPLIPACPDYGSANLLLKMPGHQRMVRSAYCVGETDRAVSAALRA